MKFNTLFTVCIISAASLTLASADPISIADVKALTKAGLSEEVILSQIRNAHTTFSLSTAEIVDLHTAGVSEKVIDYMIGAPSASAPEQPALAAPAKEVTASPPAPAPAPSQTAAVVTAPSEPAPVQPPPVQIQEVALGTSAPGLIVEAIPPCPDPYFVWVSGSWTWRHTRLGFGYWDWAPGYWTRPPYRGAVWIGGGWGHRGGWHDNHWR